MQYIKATDVPSNGVKTFIKRYLREKEILKATREGKGSFLAVVCRGNFDMGNGLVVRVSAPKLAHNEYTPFTCEYLQKTKYGLVSAPWGVLATQDDITKFMSRGVTLSEMLSHMREVFKKPSKSFVGENVVGTNFAAQPFADMSVRKLEDQAPKPVVRILPNQKAIDKKARQG